MGAENTSAPFPNYCKSMDAAWKIVEHLKKPEMFVSVQVGFSRWLQGLCMPNPFDNAETKIHPWIYNITPEVICLAALLAGGIEIER